MRRLKRLLAAAMLLLIGMLSMGFALWNSTAVPLSLGIHTFAPRPVSVWLILSLCLGVIIGMLFSMGLFRGMRDRRRIRQLEKQLGQRDALLARHRRAGAAVADREED